MTPPHVENSTPPSPLAAIVTGMEHSCTSHLSRMIILHPRLNAGFECGLLLAAKPAKFARIRPFYEWMSEATPEHRWIISHEGLSEVCKADHWHEAYRRIVRYSPLFRSGADLLVDKTPAYIRHLPRVLSKVPEVPCIIATKSILLQYHSYKRRGYSLKEFRRYYGKAERSLRVAIRRYSERILFVRQKDLIDDPWLQLVRIYRFIGLAMPDAGDFEQRIREQNRRHAGSPAGQPEYQFEAMVREANSEISTAERRVLACLPELAPAAA